MPDTTETQLAHFDRARSELALATDLDEIKGIRDKAEALRAYARQAGKSLEMQNQCAEIKLRAERRAGELIPEQIEHGGDRKTESSLHRDRLKDLDISESQSSRWQAIASIPEETFEEHVAQTKAKGDELTSAGMLRVAQKLHRPGETDTPSLPSDKYRVLYADCPWQYGNKGLDEYGHAERHYPTMSIKELCNLDVSSLAEDNSVLFFWVTSPFLEDAFKVIKSWGFSYKTSMVWNKDAHNFGHYVSVRHELLLICVRGSCTPDIKELLPSVVTIKRTTHSTKPEEFRAMIDKMYPRGKRIELFSRQKADGWMAWGADG